MLLVKEAPGLYDMVSNIEQKKEADRQGLSAQLRASGSYYYHGIVQCLYQYLKNNLIQEQISLRNKICWNSE